MATLPDSLELILAQMKIDLEAAVADEDSALSEEGIEKVVRGDRFRGTPLPTPSIWVGPQQEVRVFPSEMTYGDEVWEFPIAVAALVKGDRPEDVSAKAQRIAAHAQRVVVNTSPEDVALHEIVSDTFDMRTRANPDNRNLYWVRATVRARFTVTDGRN